MSGGDLPDKKFLYGVFQKTADWQDSLSKKLAHKALDIADDDMNIQANRSGLDWKGLAVLATAGLGGFYLYDQSKDDTTPPAAVQPGPVDSEYDVIFYDGDGNVIDVPNISTKE